MLQNHEVSLPPSGDKENCNTKLRANWHCSYQWNCDKCQYLQLIINESISNNNCDIHIDDNI